MRRVMQNKRRRHPRIAPTEPALRIIMRRLREIMAEPSDGQSRLDKIVRQIAGLMVAEVCSIYLKRQDGSLELFATEGLNPGCRPQHLHEARRGPRRPLRRAGGAHQRARRAEPSGLLLSARDGRGDLPFLPGRAGAARRRGAGRAHRPEQDPEGILRRGRRGAADHRHGAGRASGVGRGGRRQHRGRIQPRGRPCRARPAAVGRHRARPCRAARAARRRHRARGQGPRGGEPAGWRPRSRSSRPPSTRCWSRAS